MNIKRWTSTGIILGLITISMPVASAAETGWYIGGSTGEADLNLSVSDFNDGAITSGTADDDDTGRKVFGGYHVNEHLAIEGGFVDLNNDFDSKTTFEGISNGSGSLFAAGPVSVDVEPEAFSSPRWGSYPLRITSPFSVRRGS